MRSLAVGLLTVAIVAVCSSANCNFDGIKLETRGCICSLTNQTGLLLTGGSANISIPSRYLVMKPKTTIAVRNLESFILNADEENSEYSTRLLEVSLIVENVTSVVVKQRAFDQVVISAVFKDIKSLHLKEKSFSSCWGTVWLFNNKNYNVDLQLAFSSSEMVVWKDHNVSYSYHVRPKVTPRQRFTLLYDVSSKMNDLEITVFAILGLLGTIVLTLIILTAIVLSRKSGMIRENKVSETQCDGSSGRPVKRRKVKSPVIRVSRLSRMLTGKQKTHQDSKSEPKSSESAGRHRKPRPQLPVPVEPMQHFIPPFQISRL